MTAALDAREISRRLRAGSEDESAEALEAIGALAVGAEDVDALCDALVYSMWRLPKIKAQALRAERTVEVLAGLEGEASARMLAALREKIARGWLKIDTRRRDKFLLLFGKIVAAQLRAGGAEALGSLLEKCPCAELDSAVISALLGELGAPSAAQLCVFFEHLARHDTPALCRLYARVFVPALEEAGVPEELSRLAFEAGKRKDASEELRALMYGVCRLAQHSNK